MTAPRITPAQRRALALLVRPGAEAHSGTLIRWAVLVDGKRIGSVHSATLAVLRDLGLVEMFDAGSFPIGFRHRVTEAGRAELRRMEARW